jgi:hypothetical protein
MVFLHADRLIFLCYIEYQTIGPRGYTVLYYQLELNYDLLIEHFCG